MQFVLQLLAMGTRNPQASEADAFLSGLSSDSSSDGRMHGRASPTHTRSRSPPRARAHPRTATVPNRPATSGATTVPMPPLPAQVNRHGSSDCEREYDPVIRTFTIRWKRRHYIMSYDPTIGRYRPTLWENLLTANTSDYVTELWTWRHSSVFARFSL